MRFLALLKKELLQFTRNRGLVILVIYCFTLDVYIAGVGIDLSLKNAKFYAYDMDFSAESRQMVSKLLPPWFAFHGYLLNDSLIDEVLLNDKAIGVVSIPHDFSKDLKKGRARLQLLINGSEAIMGYLFSGYAGQVFLDYSLKKAGIKKENFPIAEEKTRVFFNPNMDSKYFMGISELLSVLVMLVFILPAAALVREKEMGNIEMLLISPVQPLEFMIAKVLVMAGIIIVGVTVSVFLIIKGILAVPFRGSFLLFLLFTLVFIFTTSGFGLFIGAAAKNMLQASQLSILILMPTLFLSCSWTPIEAMPAWMQPLTYISPLKYYMDASYGIALKGVGLNFLWPELLGLTVLGLILFVLSIRLLKRVF
ncbi:MAG: ABC transporter permease [Deltaproteobacteria bacterium]|nr:ABC transporter permease [Deltaproteobacteria bacterium]